MSVPELRTRRPTGKPPWPLLCIAGVEKAGKSYSGALFSASDLIDRTFWIEIGEGAADQYGAIPGARYEIVEHEGTYSSIAAAVHAATRQPRNGKPHAIVIDSMTELWDLLSDEAQATANRRARAKAAERKQPAPTDDVQITMDLWNTAKKRWRRILDELRVYDGPVVLLTRLELVGVVDAKGKPDPNGAREWKVRAEKNLVFECDAIVKMTAPQTAALTGVRSTVLSTPPGREMPLPNFTIDGLLRSLGLDAAGATAQRSYTAPQVENVDVLAEQDRPAERHSGPVDDDPWMTSEPSPLVPTATPEQLAELVGGLKAVRGIDNPKSGLAAVTAMVRRNITDLEQLTKAEVNSVLATLRAEDAEKQKAAAGPTPNDPGITRPQMTMMHAAFGEKGITDRADKLAFAARIIGHPIESSNDLTKAEAAKVINALNTGEIPVPSGRTTRDDTFHDLDAIIAGVDGPGSSDEADRAIEEELAAGRITEADASILRERLAARVETLMASTGAPA